MSFRDRGRAFTESDWIDYMAKYDPYTWPCDGNTHDIGKLLRILAREIQRLNDRIAELEPSTPELD